MKRIHHTAVVSPKAEIADDVKIGPYVVIDGEVTIGAGCIVQAHAIISNSVRIGRGNVVGYGAVIGGDPQDHSFSPAIRSKVMIGDHNRIREYCTIHRGTVDGGATMLGDHNYLMAGTHLAHDVKVGSHVTLENNVLLAGHVEIQDRVYVGGGSVFHQHIRVGKICLIQGCSKFSKNIPPYTIAVGHNNVVGPNFSGMRKAGLAQDQRREIARAFTLLYRSGMNITQAAGCARELAWNKEGRAFFDFVDNAGKRGICEIRKPRRAMANRLRKNGVFALENLQNAGELSM